MEFVTQHCFLLTNSSAKLDYISRKYIACIQNRPWYSWICHLIVFRHVIWCFLFSQYLSSFFLLHSDQQRECFLCWPDVTAIQIHSSISIPNQPDGDPLTKFLLFFLNICMERIQRISVPFYFKSFPFFFSAEFVVTSLWTLELEFWLMAIQILSWWVPINVFFPQRYSLMVNRGQIHFSRRKRSHALVNEMQSLKMFRLCSVRRTNFN